MIGTFTCVVQILKGGVCPQIDTAFDVQVVGGSNFSDFCLTFPIMMALSHR